MSEITVNAGTPAPDRAERMNATGDPLSHYVSPAPFEPYSVDVMTAEQERFYRASQWRLMWMRFRRHKVAVASGALLLVFYAVILFCEFLAPYALDSRHTDFIYAPPQRVRLMDEHGFTSPHVLGYDYRLDMTKLHRIYTPDPGKQQSFRWFCHGDPYKFWGYVAGDVHLVCPAEDGTLFLLGTDRLGRDLLSRIIYGAQIPLAVGLCGVSVSFTVGLLIGRTAG